MKWGFGLLLVEVVQFHANRTLEIFSSHETP